ncbi:MAG: glutathione S-transferase family protein [Hyphomicrobiaceae bacterium]
MRIIEQARAPNPRRVRIFVAEKGIDVRFEQVDMMTGALKTDAFTALNPFQQVPVLVLDDGTAISESIAICRYFEELHPEPTLMGRTPVEKALVEMWQRRMELNLLAPVAQVFRHSHPAMAPFEVPQVVQWAEVNRPRALRTLQLLDRELAGRPFIAGDRYSVADITALVAIDFMKPAKLGRPEGLASLERWHRDVSARPSAAA